VFGFSAAQAGDVKAAIERAGGKALFLSKRAGLGTAESADPAFADKLAKVPGIRAVAMDTVVQWVPTERVVEAGHGLDETFFFTQWWTTAVHAPEAWDNNGATGTGARVAVLDGGLNNNHVDLDNAVTVDEEVSKSFAGGAYNTDAPCGAPFCFSHATHVAGIIAAEDDGFGSIGVAPGATIIGVKVLHGGSGSFGGVIAGIVYAASPRSTVPGSEGAGAHIINMSLGAQFPSAQDTKVRALKAFMDQATTYAHNQGVLVIASAGNGDKKGRGIDHDLGQWFTLPAQADHVIGVSALGPVGFALGATNFDRLASYSNFGVRIVDFSGPGGDFVLPGTALCSLPLAPVSPGSVITRECWLFDMIRSPASLGTGAGANDNYFFAAGTSMSAPAVAGVAALVRATKGITSPNALVARLALTADHPAGGARVHGMGRVNALRATAP
jgi:subtilisin family serine protease